MVATLHRLHVGDVLCTVLQGRTLHQPLTGDRGTHAGNTLSLHVGCVVMRACEVGIAFDAGMQQSIRRFVNVLCMQLVQCTRLVLGQVGLDGVA